ncbi:hypothetical protein HXY33_05680 [Candidatus Bathyarchaeota archaeon]|nr:hypothetical protein [Candidatus Bathyarchaeota archaeon]
MAIELLPEFFLFLGIDLFIALALLTCVMEHFNRLISYLYEAAAVFGYVNMFMSREFIASFGEYMRFSYSFLYLALALANVIGINVYLLVSKKSWGTAKVFASCVTFPTVLISTFFFSLYCKDTSYVLTAALMSSAMILGIGIAFLVVPEKLKEKLERR